MEKKPKNTRRRGTAGGKGFYIAMYASMGGLLLLALGIGYYSFLGPGSNQGDIELALSDYEHAAWDWSYEEQDYPVGAQWDTPIAAQPSPRPTMPPNGDETSQDAPEGYDDDWIMDYDWEWDYDSNFGAELESDPEPDTAVAEDDTAQEPDPEADIYNVFDTQAVPQQYFSYFTEADTMHWPVLGEIVMDFAMDRLVFDSTLDQWRVNDTLAISADRGTPVRAAAPGRVQEAELTRQFGKRVVIDHGNGWFTTYSQLDPDVVVSVGDVVSRGQIIGNVGSPSIFAGRLGYHVGFAVTSNDAPVDPNDLLIRE